MGAWTFDLDGYHHQHISDDEGPGVANGNRARVTAPRSAFSFFELGSGPPLIWVHAYKELNARNPNQGTQLTVRLTWTF